MMPADIHYGSNNGKILLRNLLPKSIPDEIRWRSKRGFTPPISDWFKTILKNNVAHSFQSISNSHIVHDEVFFKSILNNHLAGNEDNTHEIFKWFMINKKFLEMIFFLRSIISLVPGNIGKFLKGKFYF